MALDSIWSVQVAEAGFILDFPEQAERLPYKRLGTNSAVIVRKDVCMDGSFFCADPGDWVEIDQERIYQILDCSNSWLNNGNRIGFFEQHGPSSRVGDLKSFMMIDGRIFTDIEITSPEWQGKFGEVGEETWHEVSPEIQFNHTDGGGNFYEAVIVGVAMCRAPVMRGQGPFVRLFSTLGDRSMADSAEAATPPADASSDGAAAATEKKTKFATADDATDIVLADIDSELKPVFEHFGIITEDDDLENWGAYRRTRLRQLKTAVANTSTEMAATEATPPDAANFSTKKPAPPTTQPDDIAKAIAAAVERAVAPLKQELQKFKVQASPQPPAKRTPATNVPPTSQPNAVAMSTIGKRNGITDDIKEMNDRIYGIGKQ